MRLFLTSEDDTATCVSCEGEISQLELPANVQNPLEQLLSEAGFARTVVMDLGPARFIDSSGIDWLLVSHKRFGENGGKLILHSVPPMIDQVLRLLQLDSLFTIKSDRAAALASAAGAKGTS
jgi:anti-anti-sigma factor